MDLTKITCPYCWQQIDIEEPERSAEEVEFVTDCEVCCRPIRIVARWFDDETEPELEVEPELE